jgi:hypothetical protein
VNWIVPTVTLIGTVIVSFANYVVQRWRYGIDRLSTAIDYFCTEVNSAADLATQYWLLDLTQRDSRSKANEIEPGLVGRQLRLQELFLTLSQNKGLDLKQVESSIVEMYDAMTGGAFRTSDRHPDTERAQKVQAVAAMINGLSRRALVKRSHYLWPYF